MPAPIFVAHHDTAIRELTVNVLRAAGYEVASFDDPMTALDRIESDTRARVLVTGISFGSGKLNGVALARMLKTKGPDIQAIFVAPPDDGRHADGVGMVLHQPLDPDALVDAVQQLIAN